MATNYAFDSGNKKMDTGVLFNADDGFGSAFAGNEMLPRSIASDGRRWVLFLHLIVHLAGLACNIAACVFMWQDFPQTQMKTGVTVAVVMHGVGILSLLGLAASEAKQLAFVVSISFIYTFLFSGLASTCVMAIFTFRSDDKLTESHPLYYAAAFLQILGISMLTACSLNMAANNDEAFAKKKIAEAESLRSVA